jgi:hypothetical protein
MQTMTASKKQVETRCACGCGALMAVPAGMVLHHETNRVKPEYVPRRYCADYGPFVVSGETGCIYLSLEHLNCMND